MILIFGDERDKLWRSDDEEEWSTEPTQSVIEQALYTSDSIFGSIQFEADRELKRRLMTLFPPPLWTKGKI